MTLAASNNQRPVDLTTGLTTAQVQAATSRGEQNTPPKPLTRSIKQIIFNNTVTLFNIINLILAAFILWTGSYRNLLFLGVAITNTTIGTWQEIRSKRQIDKMAFLAESEAVVRRDGKLLDIHQENLVLNDLLQLKRGDQLPADGILRTTDTLEVDESQLTGESKPVFKKSGEALFSGSFIVSGHGQAQITAVGADSFVSKLAAEAKQERKDTSQLLNTINRIIKVLTFIIIPVGLALFFSTYLQNGNLDKTILGTAAAILGMIPEGLVLLTSVTLAVAARNLGTHHVLVKSLPAIEALARVDVICLDKTGTITSGALKLKALVPMADNLDKNGMSLALSGLIHGLNDDNETALALQQALPAAPTWEMTNKVPFSSSRKWSGVSFETKGSYVLGAPEFVLAEISADVRSTIDGYAKQGYRVLVLAHSTEGISADGPLPKMDNQGLILITDELRPNAKETFAFFTEQDVQIKVISGDAPQTVATVAAEAGIKNSDQFIDMSTVGEDGNFAQLIQEKTVFGRVTPTQKRSLIKAYQAADHTVAMTGDGVNDVLALRQADCGIAMASGTEATKSIASFVLLNNNFDAMIHVLNEGRRVINNIERVASMYLIKTIYSVILSVLFIFLHVYYPYQPIQMTPISALTVAIPSFFLALEPNHTRITDKFMRTVMETALPSALCVVLYTLTLIHLQKTFDLNSSQTSTLTVLMIGIISFRALISISQPLNRQKQLLLALVASALAILFLFLGNPFKYDSLLSWSMAKFYLPMIIILWPLFHFMQNILGKRVFSKIKWQ